MHFKIVFTVKCSILAPQNFNQWIKQKNNRSGFTQMRTLSIQNWQEFVLFIILACRPKLFIYSCVGSIDKISSADLTRFFTNFRENSDVFYKNFAQFHRIFTNFHIIFASSLKLFEQFCNSLSKKLKNGNKNSVDFDQSYHSFCKNCTKKWQNLHNILLFFTNFFDYLIFALFHRIFGWTLKQPNSNGFF